jgi:molybdenum cofactor guanylyltransferase
MAKLCGIVLAGGRSSRMGVDKAMLEFGGITLLQRSVDRLAPVVDELVLVGAPGRPLPEVTSEVPMRLVEDPVEGEGPLVGIAAGLEACSGDAAVVVAVDMPFVEAGLVRLLVARLDGARRWVVPIAEDRPQPMCSAYAVSALATIREHLEAGDRAPMALAADLDAYRMQPEEWRAADPEGRSFVNANTPEEFALLEA